MARQQSQRNIWVEWFNQLFTFIFLLEMAWKIFALGLRQYWRDYWNRLDAVTVVITTTHLLMEVIWGSSHIPVNPSFLRILRIARLLRSVKLLNLLKLDEATQHMVETLTVAITYALPSVLNVMGLMFLFIFIFSILGECTHLSFASRFVVPLILSAMNES